MIEIKEIKITREQNKMVRGMLDGQIATYKNWITMAVDRDKYEYAKELVQELNSYKSLCHIFVPDDMFSDTNKS